MTGKQAEYIERLLNEMELRQAVCITCGNRGDFNVAVDDATQADGYDDFVDAVNLRENLICRRCGSLSRDRMVVLGLRCVLNEHGPLAGWKINRGIRIFETTGRRGHPPLLTAKYDYFNTDYEPKMMAGEYDVRKYADVQAMRYADAYFDVVVTSDVFEHVRLHEPAFREMHRVLRPGGAMIMTVPYVHGWEKTLVKVEPQGDRDNFITPPEYHGEHTLVYRIYGRDLHDLLRGIGFSVAYLEFASLPDAISRQSLIIAAKGPFVDLSGLVPAGSTP